MTSKWITATTKVEWQIRPDPPAPRHVIRWCDACLNWQHHNEDGCIKCSIDYECAIAYEWRCPECGRRECSH